MGLSPSPASLSPLRARVCRGATPHFGVWSTVSAEISQEHSAFAERAERNHREGGSRLDREYSTMTNDSNGYVTEPGTELPLLFLFVDL